MNIKSLVDSQEGRVYVFLATKEIGQRFLIDAESEGFLFRDGVKPTQRKAEMVMAINNDLTINYVGFVGYMAYQMGSSIGTQPLIKVDYSSIVNPL